MEKILVRRSMSQHFTLLADVAQVLVIAIAGW